MNDATSEIKFDYIIKGEDGTLHHCPYTLRQIEESTKLADMDQSRIVARRMYTGLKDKNGKEIYNGDIIKNLDYPGAEYRKVVWGPAYPGFYTQTLDSSSFTGIDVSLIKRIRRRLGRDFLVGFGVAYSNKNVYTDYEDYDHIRNVEVISNIYESPEPSR